VTRGLSLCVFRAQQTSRDDAFDITDDEKIEKIKKRR
jgi:hypothetical protein